MSVSHVIHQQFWCWGGTRDSGNCAILDFSGTCQWEGTAVSLAMEHCSSPYPSSCSLPCTRLASWQEGCNITSSVVCEVMLTEVKLAWVTDELPFTEVGTTEFGAVKSWSCLWIMEPLATLPTIVITVGIDLWSGNIAAKGMWGFMPWRSCFNLRMHQHQDSEIWGGGGALDHKIVIVFPFSS